MKSIHVYFFIIVAFIAFLFFSSYTGDGDTSLMTTNTSNQETNNLPQIVKGIKIDGAMGFAGEIVPLDNFDVKERLDRELMINSYWHSATLQHLKLANRYFPVIEPILKEEGVPEDFKYLAVTESGLRNVVSPAGARGIWQFMPATAREYGLVVNDEVDERYHIEKATRAACKYLKKSKNTLGNWTLAAAAYNMGTPRLKKLLETQKELSYYNLHMNEETSRYMFRILAIRAIMANPRDYGFYLEPDDYYQPLTDYAVVDVKEAVESWGDFAKKYGTTYRLLKVYNPWLKTSSLKNSAKRTYRIRVPKQ